MRQGIADSGPLALGANQIRAAQDGEVAGNERLRKAQHILQVAHAEALNVQKVDKAQTRGISQRLE